MENEPEDRPTIPEPLSPGKRQQAAQTHDLVSPERMVYTFEWEGMPGHVLLETVTLEEQDGKTQMTDHSVFQSVGDRDGMLQSGMESGAAESFDRLDEFLAKG